MTKYGDFKVGMRVALNPIGREPARVGRILKKENSKQSVHVLFDDTKALLLVPVTDLEPIAVHPIEQVHPMLAKNIEDFAKLDKDTLLADTSWALEQKYDGERQILTYVPRGCELYKKGFSCSMPGFIKGEHASFRSNTRVVGKNSGLLATNSETLEHLAHMPVPQDGPTVFDCELMHVDGFQALRSIMGSDTAKALARQNDIGQVFAMIFDVLWFNGRDLRHVAFEQRRKILESWYAKVMEFITAQGHTAYPNNTVQLSPIAWDEAGKRELLDSVLAAGGEGAMLKRGLGLYTDSGLPGRRSADILKVKPFTSDEVIITGFTQGQGKYNTAQLGAIEFAQYVPTQEVLPDMEEADRLTLPSGMLVARKGCPVKLIAMGSCGTGTREQEAQFRADPDSFTGQVMEVKFQQRWPATGRLRHPVFMRMRGDKSPDDCVYAT